MLYLFLMQMKMLRRLCHFLIQLILAIIAYVLTIPIEICTFLVVVWKYGWWALDYFDGEGYRVDVHSAGRNRSLWNFLFLKRNPYKPFIKKTPMSISQHLWANAINRDLTWVWWIVYRILYVIDRKNRKNQWHCISAYNLYLSKHIDQWQS